MFSTSDYITNYFLSLFSSISTLIFLPILDIAAFIFYMRTHHPHNHPFTTRAISDAVLILAILGLFIAGLIIYTFFGLTRIF
jgi:hypothetical protein